MLALRVAVFCLLFCGTSGSIQQAFNWFNNCNPPQTLLGKFCAALLDNDVDGDGDVDSKDFDYDGMRYEFDGEMCTGQKWEVVSQWSCRYGWSENYGRFMFNMFDNNKDGVTDASDFPGPITIPNADFLSMQYTRFKDDYCTIPANREIDRELCDEVDAMKPEDVKCD